MKRKLIIIIIPIILIILSATAMDKTRDKIWFQQSREIKCEIKDIKMSLDNIGEHYKNLIREYPGMITVELIEEGDDHFKIKTNEGTMKRTNVSVESLQNKVIVEFDEEYITSMVTSNSHFIESFEIKGDSVLLEIQINNLKAPGFLGFFLRNFGSKNIGNGFLNSYRKMFEK